MIRQEYYTPKEVGIMNETGARNVRKIAKGLSENHSSDLIYKDGLNGWRIHHLLLPHFKRKRKPRTHYTAINITPSSSMTEEVIHKVMGYIMKRMDGCKTELNYVIERGDENENNHVHGYVMTNNRLLFREMIKEMFPDVNYLQRKVFHLDGWKTYVTKKGSQITTLKNTEE